MFEQQDFFEESSSEQSQLGSVGAQVGKWLGFLTLFTVLAYTAVHAINATLSYQAHGLLGQITGIVGIISVEIIMFSLILKWHNRGITGTKQQIAAAVGFVIGTTLIVMAVVTDSWMNSGHDPQEWMKLYLGFILPVSPVLMALVAHVVDELEPAQLMAMKQAEQEREVKQLQFDAGIASMKAELDAMKAIANASLNARTSAARQIAAHYASQEVQGAIRRSALANVPALLRTIGVDADVLESGGGDDDPNVIEMPPPSEPVKAEPAPAETVPEAKPVGDGEEYIIYDTAANGNGATNFTNGNGPNH